MTEQFIDDLETKVFTYTQDSMNPQHVKHIIHLCVAEIAQSIINRIDNTIQNKTRSQVAIEYCQNLIKQTKLK